jgi:hypothetical protein
MIDKNNISIKEFENCHFINGKDDDDNRKLHLEYALSNVGIEGNILEFGVYQGTTINIISNYFINEIIWGFDSFEGLPEDWITNDKKIKYPKGHFKVKNLPTVNSNVRLVKGWFDQTLPVWLKENDTSIKFIHIDCDLYSSTKTILTLLNKFIKPGTIIVFDELFSWRKPYTEYPKWQEGEYKATVEWITEFDRKFEAISRNSYLQSAIRVLK